MLGRGCSVAQQEVAARILGKLALVDADSRITMATAGALPRLIALLGSGDQSVALAALYTLEGRSMDVRNQMVIRSEQRALESLANLHGDDSAEVREVAKLFAETLGLVLQRSIHSNLSPAGQAEDGATGGSSSQQSGPSPQSCWSCGATDVPLKKCSGCAVAAYCGTGCQKADWMAHKGRCAGLKAG